MYLIFLLIFTFFTRNIVIKATRLQVWTPTGGGGARVGRRPPLEKKVFWLYWGPFCYVFLTFRGLSLRGSLLATFYFMVGAIFWACPLPYENFCGRS